MAKLFANRGDPDQTPRSAASDLGLHCLSITFSRVSRLQWVNQRNKEANDVMESVILFSSALCASIVVHTCTNIIKTSYLTHHKNKSLAVLSTYTDVISIHPNQPKIFSD